MGFARRYARRSDRPDTSLDGLLVDRDNGVVARRRLTDLPELCKELDRGLGYEHQLVYRRPVAWMLMGNVAQARQVLDESEAKLGTRTDPAAEEFRRFGAALRQRVAGSKSGG